MYLPSSAACAKQSKFDPTSWYWIADSFPPVQIGTRTPIRTLPTKREFSSAFKNSAYGRLLNFFSPSYSVNTTVTFNGTIFFGVSEDLASADLAALEGSALFASWAFACIARSTIAAATIRCFSIFAFPSICGARSFCTRPRKPSLLVQVFDFQVRHFDLFDDQGLRRHFVGISYDHFRFTCRGAHCRVEALQKFLLFRLYQHLRVMARGTGNILLGGPLEGLRGVTNLVLRCDAQPRCTGSSRHLARHGDRLREGFIVSAPRQAEKNNGKSKRCSRGHECPTWNGIPAGNRFGRELCLYVRDKGRPHPRIGSFV